MTFRKIQEINDQKNKVSAKEIQEKTIATQAGTTGKLPVLFINKNKPSAVKFLHSYDKGVDLLTHQIYDETKRSYINYLCGMHEANTCKWCENKNWVKAVRCMIVYVYSLVGEQWVITNPVTKETKSGEYQLVRLAMIPSGKDNVNVKSLITADREKFLMDRIWLLSKSPKVMGKEGADKKVVFVNNPPEILYEEDYENKIGTKLPKLDLSPKALSIAKLPSDEIFKLILSAFEGVNVDKLLGKDEPTSEKTDMDSLMDSMENLDDFTEF